MSRDEVVTTLERVWPTQGREMASFEAPGREDEIWVQYVDGQLNLAWPFDRSPEDELRSARVRLPGSAFVISWAADATAQLAVGDLRAPEVAELVTDLFDRVLPGRGSDSVQCRVQRIG